MLTTGKIAVNFVSFVAISLEDRMLDVYPKLSILILFAGELLTEMFAIGCRPFSVIDWVLYRGS